MKLHDSTRRAVTLLIFFLAGPVLTVGILAGIMLRKSPSNAKRFEYRLSLQTGLDWKIGAVEYRAPGRMRLLDVGLLACGASEPVFHAPEVELRYVTGMKRGELFWDIESDPETTEPKKSSVTQFLFSILAVPDHPEGFWRITVPRSEFRPDTLAPEAAAAFVRDGFFKLVERFPILSEQPIQIAMDEMEVFRPADPGTPNREPDRFRFVVGNCYRTRQAYRSDWTFQLPSVSETETERFHVVRSRAGGEVEIGLATGYQPIPCDVTATFCPMFRRFGPGSRFSGEIVAEGKTSDAHSWTICLPKAFFNDLDIASLAAEYTPYPVTGIVRGLEVKNAVFGQGKLSAEGWVDLVDGSLERSLFHRLVERFRLTVRPESILDAPYGSVPFDRCKINYRLQEDGVLFWPDQEDNLFMVRNGNGVHSQPMAVFFPSEPHRRPISYHSILSAFGPDTAPIVPWTPLSQKLFPIIPVESFSSPRNPRSPLTEPAPEDLSREFLATTPNNSESIKGTDTRLPENEPIPVSATPYPNVADPWHGSVPGAVPGSTPAPEPKRLFPIDQNNPDPRKWFRDPGTRTLLP